jgi:ABC-2 type transport system permease protein
VGRARTRGPVEQCGADALSAVEAAASPRAPRVAGTGGPSTLTVLRWELRKLAAQKRTFLGLGLAALFPLIFVVVENLHQHHGRGGGLSLFAGEITQSGLATPVLTLEFLSAFMLPLIASLVAGDIVAAEDGNGTLKTILTRSVDRGQVFAAKALAAALYGALAVYVSATVATVGGVVSWGFHPVITLSGTTVSASEALLLVFASNAMYLIPLLAVLAFGVMLSATTRNSTASVVGAVGFVILLYIVSAIPGLEGIQPYLLTNQFANWHGLLRTPTDWAPILHSLLVCALYAAPALVAGYLVFLRRDVAGG